MTDVADPVEKKGRPDAAAPAIELRGISKAFGPVQANKDISITIQPGTIHGIIGENGAGKSTLMSILYGFYKADAGEILIGGRATTIANSQAAIAAGIGMVFQHFKLVENFTVLENVILGVEDGALLAPSLAKARGELKHLAEEYELEVDPDAVIQDLSVGHQQRVEILKALYRQAQILILDEPTGVLTPEEADHLFRILEGLKAQGKTIILITHKLREIMEITDNVSVMRRGQIVATVTTAQTSPEALAELMVGRKVLLQVDKKPATPGRVVLSVENLRVVDAAKVERLRGISLQVRAGEILGIAGVAGNGQSELLEVLGGYMTATGTATMNGEAIDLTGARSDGQSRRARGIAHVPEDRQAEGLIMQFEAWENMAFGYHNDPAYQKNALLMDNAALKRETAAKMQRFDVRPADRDTDGEELFRRQSAEDRAGARDRAQSRPSAGRPAHPWRRHRRHRVHPPTNRRPARRGQGDPAGLGRTGRDPVAQRPYRGHVRRSHHGRARPQDDERARTGAADGGGGRLMDRVPRWADVILIPLISLSLAFIAAGIVVALIGEDPFHAIAVMVKGAFGSTSGWGYTLYYATNYIFTGLAVAVAFHARLFNIGGEGQAAIAGIGVALPLLFLPSWLIPHWTVALVWSTLGAMLFGAGWAAIPAYLQAKRGSHIVITTIMFNLIAGAVMGWLLNGVLKNPATQNAETVKFPAAAHLPSAYEVLAPLGIKFSRSAPLNISFLLALAAAFVVWVLIWRTRLGYQMRAFGQSESAARYAGISAVKITIVAMLISGALAGMLSVNVVMGEQERLIRDFVEGAGFVGIAVSLMGRSHPVGIVLAAILFGALTQGGFELLFEFNNRISREMVLVIQALIILFTGALDNMVRYPLEALFLRLRTRPTALARTEPAE